MAQILRPISDIFFTGQTFPASQLGWTVIDETPVVDADYLELNHFGTAETWHGGLSSATDPGFHSGHIIRASAWKYDNSATQRLQVELRQGPTTVIASQIFTLTTLLQTFSYELSGAEAAAITDYTALTYWLQPTANSPQVAVAQVEVEIPDEGFAHLDIEASGPGLVVAAAASGNYLVMDGPGLRRVTGIEQPGVGALIINPTGPGWLVHA